MGLRNLNWRRLKVACLFWLLCLALSAAGHRLYKSIVHLDRTTSFASYQGQGPHVLWVGHGTLEDSLQRLQPSIDSMAQTPRALPVSNVWLAGATLCVILGAITAWLGRWIADAGVQSCLGLFAGHFFWLGAIELGLESLGRSYGLAALLELLNGYVVGTHSTGLLIKFSVAFLIPVFVGLTLHESNRCVVFQWFRRWLPLTKSKSPQGRVENYAARTAMQYFFTVWFCYVSVLWLAEPALGVVGQTALMAALVGIAVATPYMIWRTTQQPTIGQALRYSVSGSILTWTAIEIAAASQFISEPWLSDSVESGMTLLVATIVLTVTTHYLLRKPIGYWREFRMD